MAKSINTFAVILLAFPFYLAQKGRLASYINLAKPSQGTSNANVATTTTVTSPSHTPSTSPSPSPAPSPSPTSTAVSMAGTADALTTAFADASALFS